jgi:hypothetical protein
VKKTVLVVALATMLVLAFAGSAFAAGINHSGQDEVGAAGTVPTAEPAPSMAMIYEAWNTALGDNATEGNSPHGNYTTTTVKCVVCHAVHYAAPGGAPVSSGLQEADTLLRMRADEACVFCHATAGFSVNGRPVYDGLGGAIVGPGNTGGATNTGHIIGTNCSYCHTNVHGANADHSVASLDGYLLKLMPASNVQDTGADTTNMIEAITAIDHNAVNQGWLAGQALAGTIGEYAADNTATLREQAVGVFCAECHLGAYATAAAGAATNVYGSGDQAFSGHRIAAAATTDWNVAHDISSGLVSNQAVAWAPATNCKSCHDANDTFGNKAFPHSWGGTKMWLLSAADAGAPTENLPYGTAAGSAYDDGEPQLYDGVCLKCHIEAGGANGVGISF